MSFGWSAGDVVLAAKFLFAVGQALSDSRGARKQIKDDSKFLEDLTGTLEGVQEAIDNWLLAQDLDTKVQAIQQPVLDTATRMTSYLGLKDDGKRNVKDFISRSYKKILYSQYFTKEIKKLRERTAIPLQGLNTDLTILGLGRLRMTQETMNRKVADDIQSQNKKLLHDIKTWLRPVSSVENTYHENIAKVLPGTCEWLFSRPEYIDWHTPPSSTDRSLLWISGIPGAGKTNLATKIIHRLHEEKKAVAYFFCDATAQRSDIRSILTTLCWELLNQFSEDIDLLSGPYEKAGQPTETDMRDCLVSMCKRRCPVVLVDGLDECPPAMRRQLCRLITHLIPHTKSVILSRELEDIGQALHESLGQGVVKHVMIREADTREDIENFIVHDTERLNLPDEDTRREIVRRLLHGCQGMFQWAAQMIEHLLASKCMFADDFLLATEELPEGLDDLYKRIVKKLHDKKKPEMVENSKKLLHWLACAQRTLTLPELAMILRVRAGDHRQGKLAMLGSGQLRSAISGYCGSLVRFTGNGSRVRVNLAHASVKDFLLSSDDNSTDRKEAEQRIRTDINAEIAQTCLQYLCFDDLEHPPFKVTRQDETWQSLESRFEEYLENYPLLGYAATYWWDHAYDTSYIRTVQNAIKRLCSSEISTVRWLQVVLRLRGDRGIWRSSNSLSEIRRIEHVLVHIEDSQPELRRWLGHLTGSQETTRFVRWRRFLYSGSTNDFLPALHVAAFFNFSQFVEDMLRRGENPNERNLRGQTPLHLASRGDSVKSGALLVRYGADPNARGYSGTTPLGWAIDHELYADAEAASGPFPMVDFLLQHNADASLGPRDDTDSASPISWACGIPRTNDPDVLHVVEKLLDHGASRKINGFPFREPLLTSAVIVQSDLLIDLLLARGADPNGGLLERAEYREHSTRCHPLVAALRQQPEFDIVEKLLASGADPNAVGLHGRTVLHLCASSARHSGDLTALLLKYGAVSSAQSDGGSTALHDAASWQNLDAIKALIASLECYELDVEDDLGKTPLMIAVESDFREGVQCLLDASSSMESRLWQVKKDDSGLYEVVAKQAAHFPRSKKDQYLVYGLLRYKTGSKELPAHIVRGTLDMAEYWVKTTSVRCEAIRVDETEARNRTPYLLSTPVVGSRHSPVREITFVTRSHDQGWSDYPAQHGTYDGSCTFFDVVIQKPDGSMLDMRGEGGSIIHNVHAREEARTHVVVFKKSFGRKPAPWLDWIAPGDRVGIVPQAFYQGWTNHVESARIEIASTFLGGRTVTRT